jgi:hypothetical protein
MVQVKTILIVTIGMMTMTIMGDRIKCIRGCGRFAGDYFAKTYINKLQRRIKKARKRH